MTQHEQTIRAHCEQHGISIEVLPSGTVRFTGRGVDLTVTDVASVTLANLAAYEPRNDWPAYECKADRRHRISRASMP